jgi:hypothetical protein
LFTGYQGSQTAKTFLGAVVSILRHLHGLSCSRLKRVVFVADSPKAFEDYAEAFNCFQKDAGFEELRD